MTKGQRRHEERKVIVRQERLIRCYEVFKIFTADIIPAPPLTGHLQGGIDAERMKRLKEEIENREAMRSRNGIGEGNNEMSYL